MNVVKFFSIVLPMSALMVIGVGPEVAPSQQNSSVETSDLNETVAARYHFRKRRGKAFRSGRLFSSRRFIG